MKNLYQRGDVVFSFEVFPPKTAQGFESMYRTVGDLAAYKPGFISVTYGAGGSTQSQTLEIVEQIQKRFQLPTTAHFTLVGATVEQLIAFLDQAEATGADNIMALRGDPPQGQAKFEPVAGGLQYAHELVALIKDRFPHFGVGVGGYPETHQEATSAEADLLHLKRKVDAGADAVFTQLFYDNDDFLRFRERSAAVGITQPIVPGLLPILSLAQVKRITTLCGSKLPASLIQQLEECGDDTLAQAKVGVEHCTRQCEELLHEGVPGIHFYVLNRSDSVRQIMSDLFPAEVTQAS